MLRALVLLLLLANGGYYAWSQGLLRDWGMAPHEQAEPQRMANQIRPELLRVLPVAGAKPAVPPASPPTVNPPVPDAPASNAPETIATSAVQGECLQAGIFDAAQADALRRAASVLPQGSWSLERSATPGRWMVYLGRFADADALAKKRAELRTRNISFDRAGVATLEPGLSLGRFASEEAAERALATLVRKNDVRNARVVVERPELVSFQLRLPLSRRLRSGRQGLVEPRPSRRASHQQRRQRQEHTSDGSANGRAAARWRGAMRLRDGQGMGRHGHPSQ